MRTTLAALFLAAIVAASAHAEDLVGKITYELKPGCEGLKTDVRIVPGSQSAEIFIGEVSAGAIKTDASGNFLEKQTNKGMGIAGSVKVGVVVRRLNKVAGGCLGKFKL